MVIAYIVMGCGWPTSWPYLAYVWGYFESMIELSLEHAWATFRAYLGYFGSMYSGLNSEHGCAIFRAYLVPHFNYGHTLPSCELLLAAYTGRIGSRKQLAEIVWLVSLGCSGGPQRYCGVLLQQIQLWFYAKSILRKFG